MNTSKPSSDQQYSVWACVTLGVVGYKLCTSAIEIYGFFDAWNRISRSCRMDVKAVNLSKHRLVQRKNRIESSLTTQPFRSDNTTVVSSNNDFEHTQNTGEEKASVVRPFPRTTATSSNVAQCDTCCCPICLNEFEDSESVSSSSSNHPSACNHLFHTECLGAWLSKHSSCPVCRFEMLTPLVEKKKTLSSLTTAPALSPSIS
mmetsp:Transcript_2523/g.5496  ORF Transcript_2523/g.5496 Transcript_2523/m.5496 type:complete len:203 (+) Transcript_2523:350-958(+)